MRIARILFIVLVIASIVLALRLGTAIQIDTDLADISPGSQHSSQTRAAIDALQDNIQQRIILLVSGPEDAAYQADDDLRQALSQVSNLTVHASPEQRSEQMIEQLTPYRFSLLTVNQQASLTDMNADEIANSAYAAMLGLSGQVRVLPFTLDPLGIHSDTLLQLAPSNPSHEQDNSVALPIQLSITQGALNMNAQKALSQQLDELIELTETSHNVSIDRSGIFFFAAQAASSSKQDISMISTGSTIGVILLLLLVFRSLRALLLPIASIALGVGFAFILTHTVYGKVHVLTIVFGASLIGIVIDYSLHYFYHGASHANTPSNHTDQSNEKQALLRALALSLLTSIIGYAALSFSSLQALQKVAVFSCAGLFMAWLSVVCLGDWALRKPLSVEQRVFPALLALISSALRQISKRCWATLALATLIAGISVAALLQPFDDDPRVFFKAPTDMLNSERRVAEVASDYEPGQYIILRGQNTEEVYQRHALFLNKINQSKTLHAEQFTSLMNWIPSQASQDAIYQLQEKLYTTGGAADQLLMQLGQAEGATALTQEYLAAKQRRLLPSTLIGLLGDAMPPLWFVEPNNIVSFVLIQKGVNANALDALLTDIDGIEYVNTLVRTEQALSTQRQSALELLLLAYLLVAALMVLRFRQVKALWLVLIPASATSALFIASAVFGFALNLFHVMALFLVLGFGMDYAIFVHELKQRVAITLQAILLSALTSLLSFGLLGLSAIPVVASFGITLLIGNFFNLFGALVYARTQTSPTTPQTT
ncbi:MMPL family transporter [Arenicella xantha]|nr:MMPL family transporter [Arenicella xantha]